MYPSLVMGRVNHVGIYIFSFNEASVRVNKNENRQTKKQAKQIEAKTIEETNKLSQNSNIY